MYHTHTTHPCHTGTGNCQLIRMHFIYQFMIPAPPVHARVPPNIDFARFRMKDSPLRFSFSLRKTEKTIS